MRITNNAGLPGAIVEAVKNDDYSSGNADISTTALIGPPQQRVLRKAYDGKLEEDAADRIYALVGQAVHTILERAEPSAVVEKRLYMDVNGWRLSGQFDRLTLRQKTLQDYKVCSVWEVIYGLKPDRIAQLNVLAELCHQNGYGDVSNLEIVAIFRDWQKSKAKFDKQYPQQQAMRISVPLWNHDVRLRYISERVTLHQEAEKGRVVDCTASERWAKDDSWAVMKEGRKAALRVFPDEEQAWAWCGCNGHVVEEGEAKVAKLKKGISIVHRAGESTRCEAYCNVSHFCPTFAAIKRKRDAGVSYTRGGKNENK